jgi:isopentenyl-diphosphate delta-isomerase
MEKRKKEHIDLAFKSRTDASQADTRYHYEPLLGAHRMNVQPVSFAGKELQLPFWISSMTGGTGYAKNINHNLAQACREFGMGMGLGSCRQLLTDRTHFEDFNVRPIIGPDLPLYANLGICQLEELMEAKELVRIEELVHNLQADGIIIHVNPLQEFFQKEGNRLKRPPIELIETLLQQTGLKVMVKEVGQGMGPKSLRYLLQLPLEAIEFGALGGTNFSRLEQMRQDTGASCCNQSFALVGHSAEEMLGFTNTLNTEMGEQITCKQLIISGGLTSVLDGYYLMKKSQIPAIIGMGSAFLKHATASYARLKQYVNDLKNGYALANNFLTIKNE